MPAPARKIIHIDMDAFYASVELRERPELRGLPVVVAWEGARSVICAASYEARQYGLRSAMAVSAAKRLCPQAVFVPPDFALYRDVSRRIHAIFKQHTDLIEPLSLDEAYLDVSRPKIPLPYAADTAAAIRAAIRAETGLTASAGIAPNKFLAKIASDWRKPDGQYVIAPQNAEAFLERLPLGKIPGVGAKTLAKMQALGWQTAGDLRRVQRGELVHHFGRWGHRLYELARGIDHRPVEPARERVQISTETTLAADETLTEISRRLPRLAQALAAQMAGKNCDAHTLTLKLKTAAFHTYTRSQTYSAALDGAAALLTGARELAKRMPAHEIYRLIGIGVSQLVPHGQQAKLNWRDGAGSDDEMSMD